MSMEGTTRPPAAAQNLRWSLEPVVTVCYATSLQGSSVVDALLETGLYRVRALTRHPESPEAAELAKKGAEIFKCNCSKRRHVEKAFTGSYAVFASTDYFERDQPPADPDRETKEGILMADVAQDIGVGHYIWSSLPNADAISGGKMHMPQFTGKHLVEEHIHHFFEGFTTFIYPGIYCASWQKYFHPTKAADGVVEFGGGFEPTTRIPLLDVADIGYVVRDVIQRRQEFDQKTLYLAGDTITVPKMAEIYTKVTGVPARYIKKSYEEVEQQGMPEHVAMMVRWMNDYGYFHCKADRSLAKTRKHFPQLKTFEEWLRASGWTVE